MERNNESNVIARATIVVVQYTVPSHIRNLRQTEEGDGSLTVTWDAPRRTGNSAIVGYGVQHRLDGADWASESPPVRDTSGPGTSHTVTGLTNGSKYHIRVTPCNRESACLHWSERMGFSHASVSGRPQAPTPPPPPPPITTPGPVRALTLTPGDHELGVRWQAPSDDGGRAISRYPLRYKPAAATAWISNPEVTSGTETTVPILTGDERMPLTNGALYDVQVRACNGATDRTDCGEWTQQSGTPSNQPAAPRNVSLTPLGNRRAILSWTGDSRASGYLVEARKFPNGTDWVAIKGLIPALGEDAATTRGIYVNSFVAGSLALHPAYAIRVRAIGPDDPNDSDDDGELSDPSEEIVLVDSPITKALGTSDGTSGSVEMSWKRVGNIVGDSSYAGGTYTFLYRRDTGNHMDRLWRPYGFGQSQAINESDLSGGNTIRSLDHNEMYAIRLLYEKDGRRFVAVRDVYAWTSNEPASEGFFADIPLNHPLNDRSYLKPTTYGYRICEETFPMYKRSKWREFIKAAFEQWEVASGNIVTMTHEVYTRHDVDMDPGLDGLEGTSKPCADYSDQLAAAEWGQTQVMTRPLTENDVATIQAFVRNTDHWLYINLQDRSLSEVKYMSVTAGTQHTLHEVLPWIQASEELARDLGFARCVFGRAQGAFDDALGCAEPRYEHPVRGPVTDVLIAGKVVYDRYLLDVPEAISFNSCISEGKVWGADSHRGGEQILFHTLLHEAGHAIGVRGGREHHAYGEKADPNETGGFKDLSVMEARVTGIEICSPYELDVLAMYALYQTRQ